MKSTNGKVTQKSININPKEKEFDAKGICAILKSCKAAGVRELQLGALHVFLGDHPPAKQSVMDSDDLATTEENLKTVPIKEDFEQLEDDVKIQSLIDNPLDWEEMENQEPG